MKKEKREKRELTLEQLEREKEFFGYKLPRILLILQFFISSFLLIIHEKGWFSVGNICIAMGLFWVVMILLSYKISDKIKSQIILKEKQIKLKLLKQIKEKNGENIKAFVSLKDEEVITDILSNNIKGITIDFIQDKNFVVTIQYADDTFRTGICIPIKRFISILDKTSKKIVLDDLVKDIRLKNSIGDTKEIIITCQGYSYQEDVSDDELFEMFEVKE